MKTKRRFPRVILFVALACFAVPWLYTRFLERQKAALNASVVPYQFPTAELAALDRDLQARFAVVPDKDFGMARVGKQHELYRPETAAEKQTIANLKAAKTDVAFYLMSRSAWLGAYQGIGYMPIQGPVYVTKKISGPLPRREVIHSGSQEGKKPYKERPGLLVLNAQGTPVPSPTPLDHLPESATFTDLGKKVFDRAEGTSQGAIGLSGTTADGWKVSAVTIRASKKACLNCHAYNVKMSRWQLSPFTRAELGDALGVAFYLYRQKSEARQKP